MIKKKQLDTDIADSAEDQKRLAPETAILNLPELKDIPGALRSGKHAEQMPGDTTVASADEEGDELFEADELDNENVSELEKKLLDESFDPPYDTDLPVQSISLDDRDNQGERLEEAGESQDLFGGDLDDELIEEEDEETTGEPNNKGGA